MSYLGDIAVGATITFKFTTRRFTTGAPFTLAGSPAVKVYKTGSDVEDDSGITLTADYDSKTGLNHVVIDTSADGTFYAAGADYQAVITAGTVDSVSVVNEVVAQFSIANRPLQSIGASVITATSIATDAIGAAELADGAITAATFAAGAIDATAIANGAIDAATFAAGAITATVIATDAIDADALAADALTEINAQVVDGLNVDTYAEPGQGTPAATTTLSAKIGYLYKAWRNKTEQTATEYALYADDASTKDQEAIVSDDGTTFTRGEVSTGA